MIRHRGIAHRAQIDRVEVRKAIESVRVHHRPCAAEELTPPRKLGELERARSIADGAAQHVHAGRDHLAADPIASDYRDVEGCHMPGGVNLPSCASQPPSA